MDQEDDREKAGIIHKLATILGTVLCVILLPILIINVMLIIRSFTNRDEVPSVGGVFPLIVLTDSMYPDIQSGDLIICRRREPESIEKGDVIAFFDPAGNGSSIVSHSVAEITEVDGQIAWVTRGIANNTNDAALVPADKLVGVYKRRIPGVGRVVLFMQTSTGLILCVVCPILLLVIWDIIRRRRYEKRKQADTDALLRELEELRAQKEQQVNDSQTPAT